MTPNTALQQPAWQGSRAQISGVFNVSLLYKHVRKLKKSKGLKIAVNDDRVSPNTRFEKD